MGKLRHCVEFLFFLHPAISNYQNLNIMKFNSKEELNNYLRDLDEKRLAKERRKADVELLLKVSFIINIVQGIIIIALALYGFLR